MTYEELQATWRRFNLDAELQDGPHSPKGHRLLPGPALLLSATGEFLSAPPEYRRVSAKHGQALLLFRSEDCGEEWHWERIPPEEREPVRRIAL